MNTITGILVPFACISAFLTALPTAAALPENMRLCRSIEDSNARLACYDSTVDRDSTAPTNPPNSAASAPAAQEMARPRPPTGEELFGKSASGVAESISGAAKVKIPDSLTATVAALARARDDRLSVTLDNRQMWRQVDTAPLDLHVGDKVTIRAAMLGSFLLTREHSNRNIRVSRVR